MWKFLFFLFFIPLHVKSQEIVPISDANFPEAIVSAPNNYDLQSILEYNNDADLYMEFGFKSLVVQEIAWKNARIKVEVYQLGSPEGAFGAYTLSVIKCLHRDTLSMYDCNSIYQHQVAYGDLYISVTSESGSDTARSHYLPVVSTIMQKNPRQNLSLPQPFNLPKMKKWQKNLVYIQGPVGLQNSLYPWQDIFLSVRFAMFAIYVPNSKNGIYLSRIIFETNDDMMRFLGLAGLILNGVPVSNTSTNDGLYRAYTQLDSQTIYFLQSQEPWPIDELVSPEK